MKCFDIITCVLVLLTICASAHETKFESSKKSDHTTKSNNQPHIITIIADDLGWNDVSFHGADQIPTPNIDALAANGIILNRYYVLPTCTPSRSAYLTGQYPLRNGLQGFPLSMGERRGIPLERTLLPEHLRNLGYTTRLVGKWHVGYYSVNHTPTHRGFDSFVGYYNGYIKYFDHTIRENTTNETGSDFHRDTVRGSIALYTNEYFTDFVTKEVEEIIKSHDISKPLYLQVAHLAPHSGEPEEPTEVWNLTEVNENFHYINDKKRREYAGMVSRLDYSVGRIVKALGDSGILENSIIIFTTDNGAQTEGLHENYGSNYPLRGLKFSMFEGGVRGVGCVYSPLLRRSSNVSNELMHITDWLPTLYSAAGGDLNDLGEIDGFNQWPVLRDGQKSPRTSLILNIDEKANNSGAVFGHYKLLKGNNLMYSHFYGDNGEGDNYPSYNVTATLNSDVGKAVAKISNNLLTPDRLIELRNKLRISCKPFKEYVNCTETCLFNLSLDPCETVDISAENNEILEYMENYITRYNAILMPQTERIYDIAASAKYTNGVWLPWVKLSAEELDRKKTSVLTGSNLFESSVG